MFIVLIALAALLYSAFTMTGSLMKALLSGSYKASLTYSFLFSAYLVMAVGFDSTVFNKLQAIMAAFIESGLFSASNHFVLSLDLVFLFSALILISYHRFKLAQILPVKQSI